MEVLIISPTVTGIGGIAQHVRDLIKFLEEHNHNVDVISTDNTPFIPIKKLKNPSFFISSFLKSTIMKKYDIVHALHPIGALAMKNISGKKILTIHGIYNKQIQILHGNSSSNFSNWLEKNGIKWADYVTAGSKESFEYYKNFTNKISYIPNGLDIDNLSTQIDKRYEKQVIFVGRLSKEKGILTFLDAIKNLSNKIDFLIIGDGPQINTVKKLQHNLKNLHYLGYLPKEQVIPLIRGSDILVQPSLVEGISATLLEAMACKTPVITTNVGGNSELFQNNESGILIEPNNSQQLEFQITNLLSNPLKLNQLSNCAFNVVKQYDWTNIGKKYLELYEKLLKN